MNAIQMAFNINGLTFPNQDAELSSIEKKILDLIPTGRINAKSCSYIANTLHIGKRTVIEIVRKLRLKHFGIGSTTTGGYYKFKDEKEYLEFTARYSKEQVRRNQVLKAMRQTPMARKITISVNQDERSID